jgi:hypothetical protein
VHKGRILSAAAGGSLLLLGLVYPRTVLASGLLTGTHAFSVQTSRHKILRINPTCFIAGRRTWAHITLNRVGPHDQVEFVWAMPGILSTGPGPVARARDSRPSIIVPPGWWAHSFGTARPTEFRQRSAPCN